MNNLFADERPPLPQVILRPYQQQMVNAWQAFIDKGGQRGLIIAATGAGKTVLFSSIVRAMAESDLGFTALALAHRKELLEQIAGTMDKIAPHLNCSIHSGDLKADRISRVVAASVQSLAMPGSEALQWLAPNLVIVDEAHHCFVAGTKVDGKPIESFAVGDPILAYDHEGNVHHSTVTAVMKNRPRKLVRLTFSSGSTFICTPEHPIYDADLGQYIPAIDALERHCLCLLEPDHEESALPSTSHLSHLRNGFSVRKPSNLLLRRMPKNRPEQGLHGPMRGLRHRGSVQHQAPASRGAKRKGLLLRELQFDDQKRSGECDRLRNEPQVCVRADEVEESYAERFISSENGEHTQSHRASALCSDGQRFRTNRTPIDHVLRPRQGVGARICRSDTDVSGERISDALQTRPRPSGNDDRRRVGRRISSESCSAGTRQEAGRILGISRVDSVEVLEPGSDGKYGGLCQDGFVYNLEVEGFHNYFAEGILVHNCAADSYQRVVSRFGCYDEPGTYLLGVTATPHRLDNKALVGSASKAIFEEIVFRYDIVQAIKDGFLVDLRGYRAQADVDLSKVKTRAGEYVQSDLEEAMNVDPVNELALRSWKDAAAGRQTIIFCSGVDHAKKVAEVFREGGIAAEAIYGDMPRVEREAAIERFRSGKTTVLTNMDILTEGFDSQACSCVVMLRPTKSWSLFVQMCGRALRVLPGVIDGLDNAPSRREAISRSPKIDCLVIDIVGLTSSHQLTAKANGQGDPCLNALVGLPSEMDLEGRSVVEALEEFEELPEIVKAAAFRRKTSFSGLSAVLTQVEMLAEIEPPEEAVEAGADLYWMKIGDSDYIVDCGTSPQGIARSAAISADLLGNLTLRLSSGDKSEGRALRDQEFELDADLQVAFIQAEAIIQKNFFGVARLASRKAQWRLGSPTQAQLSYLKSCGIHEDVLHTLTKGTASAMIGMLRRKGIGPQKEVA